MLKAISGFLRGIANAIEDDSIPRKEFPYLHIGEPSTEPERTVSTREGRVYSPKEMASSPFDDDFDDQLDYTNTLTEPIAKNYDEGDQWAQDIGYKDWEQYSDSHFDD